MRTIRKRNIRVVQPAVFTVDDVRAHLRRYGVADGLQIINRLSRWLFFDKPTPGLSGIYTAEDLTITQWDLAFLAKQLILCSNDHRSGRLSTDTQGFHRALSLVSNMRDPVLGHSPPDTTVQRLNSLVRIAYQQFRHQGWAEDGLFRTYLLYDRTWRALPPEMDLEKAALEVYGESIVCLLALGFALLALAGADDFSSFKQTALINIEGDSTEKLRALLTDEAVTRLWPYVSIDYTGFRTLCADNAVPPSYARFEFNPLEARPVIATQTLSTPYVIPSVTALLLRFTEGVYYDFLKYYDAKGNQREFTSFFGKVFEQYVGHQLRSHYDAKMVIGEREYRVGKQSWRGPDWIVVEGESAILIECRASRLVLRGKATADENAIRDDVSAKLLPVIRHFPEKTAHIREHSEVWPELRGVKRFYPVIVTYDPWWPAQPFHEIIDRELAAAGINCDPYHIISIDALEALMSLAATGIQISKLLQKRIDRGQQGFFMDVTEEAKQAANISANKVLIAARDHFFESIGV